MALQSTLLRRDPKLEAAAASDPAHILPGARGPHVTKIQQALNQLDRTNLTEDGVYGPRTAAAVLAYKRARNIVNFQRQTQADNIVGKMTIAALDRELLGLRDPTVIIGRPVFVPNLSFALNDAPVKPTTANVSAVIRGNPHVAVNASDKDGLPPSIPPGQSYEVDLSVIPFLTGSDFIDVEIINNSPFNGTAVITSPKQIQRSAKVVVRGGNQTVPGNAAKLQIQASLNGRVLAVSNGFSVCAHPKALRTERVFEEVDDGIGVGMVVLEALLSDSGSLDQTEISELVEQFAKDEPPFHQGSGFVNHSGFATPKGVPGDRHVEPRPAAGPKGQSVRLQAHMFNCKRCGATEKAIPFSGFEIKHEVFREGNEFKHRVVKTPSDIGIQIPGKKTIINAKAGAGITVRSAVHKLGP